MPINERSSVALLSAGARMMADTLLGLGRIPVLLMTWPKYSSSSCARLHFFGFTPEVGGPEDLKYCPQVDEMVLKGGAVDKRVVQVDAAEVVPAQQAVHEAV